MSLNTRSQLHRLTRARVQRRLNYVPHPRRSRYCACGFDRDPASRRQRLTQRNLALAGVGVQQSISENA